MNQTISPKAAFLDNHRKIADQHQELMSNPAFKIAVESALLEFIFRQTNGEKTPAELGYVGVKIQGARGFIEVLLNLGEKGKPMTQDSSDTLEPI